MRIELPTSAPYWDQDSSSESSEEFGTISEDEDQVEQLSDEDDDVIFRQVKLKINANWKL